MRYSTRLTLGMLLAAVVASEGFAEETKAHWWNFGRDKDAPSAPASVTPAPTMTPANPVVTPAPEESWFAWPSVPKMSWPEFGHDETTTTTTTPTTPAPVATSTASATETKARAPHTNFGKPTHESRPRNTWAQKPASDTSTTPKPSTWHSVTEGTRTAWHKTVDYVTPGENSQSRVVATETHSSWWHRMWGSDETKKEGPQTVTEWMAQDRIDP